MSSSSPLNPHPQDAVAGHDAKSGIGALQRAAGAHRPGEQHLIERGYVPVRQLTGKVVGVWGDAHIRTLDGEVKPLHVGDVVKKGEVVLTAQDGIVQLEAHPTQLASDDVERAISQVDNGQIDVVPAAGPNSGGAGGSLEEGLRVGRDAESVTPAALDVHSVATPVPSAAPLAVAPLPSAPVANPDTESTATDTPVAFDPRGNDGSPSGLTIVTVAGHPIGPGTPVTLPQGVVTMNADGSLAFTPSHGFSGSLSFTATTPIYALNAAGHAVGPALTNLLTINFTNAVFTGTSQGLTMGLAASTPASTISFTSDFRTFNRADWLTNFDFAIAGNAASVAITRALVDPTLTNVTGTRTLNSFRSNATGTFAASAVPESATWMMMIMGFAAVGLARRADVRRFARVTV